MLRWMAVEMLPVRSSQGGLWPLCSGNAEPVQSGRAWKLDPTRDGTPSVRPLRADGDRFPMQEGTARQESGTHAKPAPDYHRGSSGRCWAVLKFLLTQSPARRICPRGKRLRFPKLGEIRWKRALFGFFLSTETKRNSPQAKLGRSIEEKKDSSLCSE